MGANIIIFTDLTKKMAHIPSISSSKYPQPPVFMSKRFVHFSLSSFRSPLYDRGLIIPAPPVPLSATSRPSLDDLLTFPGFCFHVATSFLPFKRQEKGSKKGGKSHYVCRSKSANILYESILKMLLGALRPCRKANSAVFFIVELADAAKNILKIESISIEKVVVQV